MSVSKLFFFNLHYNSRANRHLFTENNVQCTRSLNEEDDMSANTTNFTVRMNKDVKAQVDALYNALGMSLTTAFNVFVSRSLYVGGLPFDLKLDQPDRETVAAMLEAERIAKDPSVKGYDDLDELFADLKK